MNVINSPIRVITASAIFDGHDAGINIVRRLLQDRGAEVIHLGHNRSVEEIVKAALEEDVNAICISSYQGGHIEYFKYLVEQLKLQHAQNILIFAGGGGTISEVEVEALQAAGVRKVYTTINSSDLGLDGIGDEIVSICNQVSSTKLKKNSDFNANYLLAKKISLIQNNKLTVNKVNAGCDQAKVIGITGTGGAGKSTLIDEILKTLIQLNNDNGKNNKIKIACIAIDPSRKKTGGALLGDRIHINSASNENVFFRSLSTGENNTEINPLLESIIIELKNNDFGLIMIETSGIGQGGNEICQYVDHSVYVMNADYGAPGQLEKISMLDYADSVVLNKADHKGSEDAFYAICHQWKVNHTVEYENDKFIPVFSICASFFNDQGLFEYINYFLNELGIKCRQLKKTLFSQNKKIVPDDRQAYLSDISKAAKKIKKYQLSQCEYLKQYQYLYETLKLLDDKYHSAVFSVFTIDELESNPQLSYIKKQINSILCKIDEHSRKLLTESWSKAGDVTRYKKTLSHTEVPLISLHKYSGWNDQLNFLQNENVPGEYPFTAGVYKLRSDKEDPTRMFAGEGTPEDTNRRFFLLKEGQKSIRLSTAFDPLVLYAKDPQSKLDSYGCIGMSGVSIACLDDMKKLYSGIDLCADKTSVSMTINGPASILMAYFLNTAIDQQIEIYLKQQGDWEELVRSLKKSNISQPEYQGELPKDHNLLGLGLLGVDTQKIIPLETYNKISQKCGEKLRGTLQADIFKEEQAQNECLYSLEFSLLLMSDLQKYFIQNNIKHFYSVSISGYHIAEAGANPVTQLAFTLANGFTLLEYYISQGMKVDEFCSQFSFFFSNGMDAEYAVIGRVARRIWATALKNIYSANLSSQKLKYHIQTSGRSLQAQDIELNDIRTSLQALYAINDNCNSLHTNAYDEAVTTPTDESVRRALAIQLIINRELGVSANQNPLQGSFIITELTDMLEQAVYDEFDRISNRGGVIGAMEYFYQRNKIQEESLYAENLRQSAELPIIGVNQFVNNDPVKIKTKFIHSTATQKQQQIDSINQYKLKHKQQSSIQLELMKKTILAEGNSFQAILKASRLCSLQQISDVLKEVGGEYRRKM
ncbi:MAG: methylmalonyl-CoA mutase family protein [Pseudomonadota bacterium]